MCDPKNKIKILFLCTGNACRSQIAEGWARHLKGDIIDAYSAGIQPIGVSSKAIKVMAEAGVDISKQKSQHMNEFRGIDFDYVVTLCDNAAKTCPSFGGKAKVIHKPIEDPYFAAGGEDDVMELFRRVRDRMKAFVEKMPENLHKAKTK